ncbi:hypothetical protein NST17_20925 [Caldifermentibacillus hisashii]|uniref:Uncharacterized protein n=1 Tax=Caldifermentibacillus hisashii TaxID=996558 RepID=A0ABU9K3I0_9BACI
MTEQELLQEALEWQEHIRKLITATDDELYHKRSKVFDWLLERVQVLEKENKQLKADGNKSIEFETYRKCVRGEIDEI